MKLLKKNKKQNLHSKIFKFIKENKNININQIQKQFNLSDKFIKKYKVLFEDRIKIFRGE